jgi:hypothetical protein
MSFAEDRLSNEELYVRGIARLYKPPPTPAEEALQERLSRPLPADIPGTIYVLQALPLLPVKIGFTRAGELGYRIKHLQTGCPYPLKVIAQTTGLPAREREIHKTLTADRLTGEWFDWTPRVQALIATLESDHD